MYLPVTLSANRQQFIKRLVAQVVVCQMMRLGGFVSTSCYLTKATRPCDYSRSLRKPSCACHVRLVVWPLWSQLNFRRIYSRPNSLNSILLISPFETASRIAILRIVAALVAILAKPECAPFVSLEYNASAFVFAGYPVSLGALCVEIEVQNGISPSLNALPACAFKERCTPSCAARISPQISSLENSSNTAILPML